MCLERDKVIILLYILSISDPGFMGSYSNGLYSSPSLVSQSREIEIVLKIRRQLELELPSLTGIVVKCHATLTATLTNSNQGSPNCRHNPKTHGSLNKK